MPSFPAARNPFRRRRSGAPNDAAPEDAYNSYVVLSPRGSECGSLRSLNSLFESEPPAPPPAPAPQPEDLAFFDSSSDVSYCSAPSWLESEEAFPCPHQRFAESHSTFRPGDRRVLHWIEGVGTGVDMPATTHSDDDDSHDDESSDDSCSSECGYCNHADDCDCGCRERSTWFWYTEFRLSVIWETDEEGEEDHAESEGQLWSEQLDADRLLDETLQANDDLDGLNDVDALNDIDAFDDNDYDEHAADVRFDSLHGRLDHDEESDPATSSSDGGYATEVSEGRSACDSCSEGQSQHVLQPLRRAVNPATPLLDSHVPNPTATSGVTSRESPFDVYEADHESLDDKHTTEDGTSPETPTLDGPLLDDLEAFNGNDLHPTPTLYSVPSSDDDDDDDEPAVRLREGPLRRKVATMQLRSQAMNQPNTVPEKKRSVTS